MRNRNSVIEVSLKVNNELSLVSEIGLLIIMTVNMD